MCIAYYYIGEINQTYTFSSEELYLDSKNTRIVQWTAKNSHINAWLNAYRFAWFVSLEILSPTNIEYFSWTGSIRPDEAHSSEKKCSTCYNSVK